MTRQKYEIEYKDWNRTRQSSSVGLGCNLMLYTLLNSVCAQKWLKLHLCWHLNVGAAEDIIPSADWNVFEKIIWISGIIDFEEALPLPTNPTSHWLLPIQKLCQPQFEPIRLLSPVKYIVLVRRENERSTENILYFAYTNTAITNVNTSEEKTITKGRFLQMPYKMYVQFIFSIIIAQFGESTHKISNLWLKYTIKCYILCTSTFEILLIDYNIQMINGLPPKIMRFLSLKLGMFVDLNQWVF